MTTTATAQYAALRIDGRYRVIDRITNEYVAVCSSKAKAAEKAAKLNADAAAEAEETRRQAAIAAQAAEAVKVAEAIVAAVSPAAAKGTTRTEDGAVILASGLVEGSPEANAAEAAESARLDAELGITPAAKPEADTKAYRIGKVLREYVLAQTVTPATSGVTDHIASRNVCYDGTATLRLSFGDAAVLAQMAAELEKAATSPWAIMAARSAQKTLRNLFVGATV